MADFIFHPTTKVYFGKGNLPSLGAEIAACAKDILMVYGGGSIKKNGIYDKVMEILQKAGVDVVEFNGVESNPRLSTVRRGTDLAKESGAAAVLAIGGGSVIDCAKAVAAGAVYGGDPWDLLSYKVPAEKALPVFTVLTMSGTGSEMSSGSVITNEETKEKIGLDNPCLRPKASFLVPEFTYTVSPYQTACGSADVISHFFDFYYFAKADNLSMQRSIMESIMRTVVDYTPQAIKEPNNYEARANLMWAAAWGCSAITDSFAAGASMVLHFMEHELSAYYDVTHGHGLAILMPRWMEYVANDETMARLFYRFGVNVMGVDASLGEADGVKATIAALDQFLFDELGLKSRLSDLNIDEENFREMAEEACRLNGGKLQALVPLTAEDVVKIFTMCL
ncbi:MAG: iron-containing alcohol dehydrogenase [Schwartzia sp.]|nr:iron-containing alcohol dehydrogenase [Schwartzia sp. (in: firmicutes)]